MGQHGRVRQSTPAPVMTDVARLAGVSHQTVSRVVNDSPHVSGPTRAKVLAAMEQLGYRRNGVARALARRRSGTLGVITFDTVLYGPVSTLYSVEQAASSVGLGVTIAVVEEVAAEDVVRALARLQDQSVEGVIALAPQRDAVDTLIAALRSTPSVFVGGVIGGSTAAAAPRPPATCSTSATARSTTWPDRRTTSTRSGAPRAGATPSPQPPHRSRPRRSATGARARATRRCAGCWPPTRP
jgi:hypothetical protein